jgi:hypothetical protein
MNFKKEFERYIEIDEAIDNGIKEGGAFKSQVSGISANRDYEGNVKNLQRYHDIKYIRATAEKMQQLETKWKLATPADKISLETAYNAYGEEINRRLKRIGKAPMSFNVKLQKAAQIIILTANLLNSAGDLKDMTSGENLLNKNFQQQQGIEHVSDRRAEIAKPSNVIRVNREHN